jgi:hypothetical protein
LEQTEAEGEKSGVELAGTAESETAPAAKGETNE